MVFSNNKRKSIKCYNVNNYTNSLYLRFEVKDKPGVLSTITNRLAKYKISVKRLIQTPDKKNNKATIVIITHKTNELNSKNCLSIFKKDKNILKYPTLIRIIINGDISKTYLKFYFLFFLLLVLVII